MDKWLTERYCLYLKEKDQVYRYDIHHKEWELNQVIIHNLDLNYQLGRMAIEPKNYFAHYSKGIEVIAWGKVKI